MSETGDPLYRKDLLRLAANVVGAGRLDAPDSSATAHNPTCGDRVTIDLALRRGRILALAHHTHACVLTQASAAILADVAEGLDRAGIAALAAAVDKMLKTGSPPPRPAYTAFDGVAGHAGRHKCVLLPFEATLAALDQREKGR